jgi:hypothetical protein
LGKIAEILEEEAFNFRFKGVRGDAISDLDCGFTHFVLAVVPSFRGDIVI